MNRKIFIVDDDNAIRSLLSTLLGMEGFEIIKDYPLSQEGILETIRAERPDVVLMDVHIKDLNGIEILKLLRSEPDLQKTRVILSSGQDLRKKCLDAGANEFLMKPYMPAELLDIIK